MKRILIGLSTGIFLLLFSSCMLPLASKSFQAYDPQSSGTRIRQETQGTLLVLSLIPTGAPLDLKEELDKMKSRNKCKDLKNIDVTYYDNSFYIVGFEKMLIRADCLK